MKEKLKKLFEMLRKAGLSYVQDHAVAMFFNVPRNEAHRSTIYTLSRSCGLDWHNINDVLRDIKAVGFEIDKEDVHGFDVYSRVGSDW